MKSCLFALLTLSLSTVFTAHLVTDNERPSYVQRKRVRRKQNVTYIIESQAFSSFFALIVFIKTYTFFTSHASALENKENVKKYTIFTYAS